MELINCGKGHFYDPNSYSSCPQCAAERRNGGANVVEGYGATQPVFPHSGMIDFPNNGEGVTVPPSGSVHTIPPTQPDNVVKSGLSQVQSYGLTSAVPLVKNGSTESASLNPVVGWLVCTGGVNKGADYRIHNGYNYIGRGESMDICIQGDNCISSEKAAMISFDNREKVFFFGPGGHNPVRVNGKMIHAPVQIQPYDELEIGESLFRFVPFCGERFDWNE